MIGLIETLRLRVRLATSSLNFLPLLMLIICLCERLRLIGVIGRWHQNTLVYIVIIAVSRQRYAAKSLLENQNNVR